MKRIPVIIEDEQHEELRQLAFDTKLSISEHIRRAVGEYLKDPLKKREDEGDVDMILIMRENFEQTGHKFDYELENGVLLHAKKWNGEVYTVKEGKTERSFRPVQIHNEIEDTWQTIGFEES